MSRSAKVSLRSAIIAAIAMMATFAAAALPIPLYADYQATLGLTDSDVSLTTVYYLAGVLVVLFMGGSLSDALGRKPMVAASLAFGALGCAVFAVACGSSCRPACTCLSATATHRKAPAWFRSSTSPATWAPRC